MIHIFQLKNRYIENKLDNVDIDQRDEELEKLHDLEKWFFDKF